MQLILVRHGQTYSNLDGLLDTVPPGASLTELGHRQAAALVELLASDTVGSVSASQALRAQQTAAPLAAARGLGVDVREGLTEIAAGDWEMSGAARPVRGWLAVIGAWMEGDLDARTPGPGGESGHDALGRFDRAIATLCAETAGRSDAAHVVVAHGAIIRCWASIRSANLDTRWGADHPLGNTAVVRLQGDPATGWVCTGWGDAAVQLPGAQVVIDPTSAVVPTS